MKNMLLVAAIVIFAYGALGQDDLRLLSDNPNSSCGTNMGCSYTVSKPPDYWNKPLTGRELLDGSVTSTADSIAWKGNAEVNIDLELPAEFPIETVKLLMRHFTGAYRIRSFEVYLATEQGKFGEPVAAVADLSGLGQGPHEVVAEIGGKPARWVRVNAKGGGLMVIGEIEIWGRVSDQKLHEARLSGGVLKYNLGPASSISPPGFTLVTDETAFDDKTGCGWLQGECIGSLFNGLPDLIFGNLVWGGAEEPGRLRVAVNPGRYRVIAFLGDLHELAPYEWQEVRIGDRSIRIQREGPPASGKWFDKRWPMLQVAELDVEASEPRLTVEFSGSPCWSVCGLVVARLDKADAVTVELHESLKKEREGLSKFVLTPAEREQYAPASPTEQEEKQGYLAFGHPYAMCVFRETLPAAGSSRTASAELTPGEYEPITFSVRAFRPIFAVKVEASTLVSAKGDRIPASCMRIHSVRLWPQRIKSSWGKEYDLVHEVLDPLEGAIDIPPAVTREFWVTMKAPDDIKPGTYKGKFSISGKNVQPLELPVEVRILPFRLAAQSERITGVYFKYPPSPKQDVEKQLADMHEHGVDAVTMSFRPAATVVDDKLEMDFSRSDEFVSLLKKYGITGPMPFHPPAPRDKYVECVQAIVDHAREKNWPEVLFYPVDEPGNSKERQEKVHQLLQLIKRVPGAVTYVTCNGKVEDYVPKIDPWMDVRCYQMLSYTEQQQDDTRKKGDRLYFYYGPIGRNPKSARLVNGFYFWRTGAKALYYWHYQYVCGSPKTDFDTKTRDWCAVYPGPDAPLATVAWEAVREGIDDLRYIELLNKAISESSDDAAVAEAKKVLERVRNAIDPNGPNFKESVTTMKAGQMDRYRAAIARCICRLKKLDRE